MHPLSGHTLVFLPGLDGTGISFEPLGRILPEDVSVTVIRYPDDQLLTFEETVRCAAEQIGPQCENAIVLAESFSGPVAVELVSSGMLKPKGLVLCATFARAPRPGLFKLLSYLPLAWLIRMPFPKYLFKHLVEGGEKNTELFVSMWQRVKVRVQAKVLVHRFRLISRVDVRNRLTKLAVPCLYIQAAGDRSIPESALSDFTRAVSDLSVKRIKGPHYILQAEPNACLAVIQEFCHRACKSGKTWAADNGPAE
jgi:pimeloyl-[acyl-carrier protein] methyl ester esterase